mgnify:CR=1 FL=1
MSDYDLTALDRPLGEYPDEVIGAILRAKVEGRIEEKASSGVWFAADKGYYAMSATYRLVPEPLRPMTPPWDVLPRWVQSVVRNEGSEWVFGLEIRDPNAKYGRWYGTGRAIDLTDFRFDRGNMPWNESLVLRPEGV